MPAKQFRWFILTIPEHDYAGEEKEGCVYGTGQLEEGEGGYRHWQICICTGKPRTASNIRNLFGGRAHVEATRSAAAREYVRKEDTRIDGTEFEWGRMPVRRNSKTDWDSVWAASQRGDLDSIPKGILVPHYRSIRAISSDFSKCVGMEREATLHVGPTGTGKSHTAWEQAGMDAYSKDPRTKFWDGYRGEESVVIDEFRGSIDISHILRWLDKYPVRVEIKGSSMPLQAKKIWFTSNVGIEQWYPDIDDLTMDALKRRIKVINFPLNGYL